MASLLGKLVGGSHHKEDELPADYAGALPPAGHASGGSSDDVGDVEKPTLGGGGEYKTVVEGTGAGYGEMEYAEEVVYPVEKHPEVASEEKHDKVGSVGSFGSAHHEHAGVGGEGKQHHDKEGKQHTGPISKIKHKVKEGLAKVHKKKDHPAGTESHSSTSSDDEAGALQTETRYAR